MTRSLEELKEVPMAVVLDHELPVLFEYFRESEWMTSLMAMVLKGRGLEDKYPEWFV